MFSLAIRWRNYNAQDDVMNIFIKALEKQQEYVCFVKFKYKFFLIFTRLFETRRFKHLKLL